MDEREPLSDSITLNSGLRFGIVLNTVRRTALRKLDFVAAGKDVVAETSILQAGSVATPFR